MYNPKYMINYQINLMAFNQTKWQLGVNMNRWTLTLKHPSILPHTSSVMVMCIFKGDCPGMMIQTGGILLFISLTFHSQYVACFRSNNGFDVPPWN